MKCLATFLRNFLPAEITTFTVQLGQHYGYRNFVRGVIPDINVHSYATEIIVFSYEVLMYIPAWQVASGITHGEMTPQIASSPVRDSRVRVIVTPIHFILYRIYFSLAGRFRNHTRRTYTTDFILSCLGQSR